ncbi:MAG: hypothetical protein EZS28_010684 [Streblomastix strix]|uniref:Uncharacterized protein n=1 Tax=Streblomastix strix TaxID=222440 RepID=A0A5J4WHM0_9EUKA|nr:MAG: hypothetical protein EZS28_010684 [Streblomastix strix]
MQNEDSLFVDALTGSDGNDCTSEHVCKTIGRAVTMAPNYIVISLQNQTLTEISVVIQSKSVRLEGKGNGADGTKIAWGTDDLESYSNSFPNSAPTTLFEVKKGNLICNLIRFQLKQITFEDSLVGLFFDISNSGSLYLTDSIVLLDNQKSYHSNPLYADHNNDIYLINVFSLGDGTLQLNNTVICNLTQVVTEYGFFDNFQHKLRGEYVQETTLKLRFYSVIELTHENSKLIVSNSTFSNISLAHDGCIIRIWAFNTVQIQDSSFISLRGMATNSQVNNINNNNGKPNQITEYKEYLKSQSQVYVISAELGSVQFSYSSRPFTIQGCTFSGFLNKTYSSIQPGGGALSFSLSLVVKISQSSFIECHSIGGSGGALSISLCTSTASVTNSIFINNSADTSGGSINIIGGGFMAIRGYKELQREEDEINREKDIYLYWIQDHGVS